MAGSALLSQLDQLRERVAPVTLAAEQVLAVPEVFQPLFASGGLPRGASVGFTGAGSWSVALTLAASALGAGGWLAVLGVEELGLVAAAELGVRLDRVLVISSLASAQLALVAATLMEAVDVIALHPRSMVSARDARRLTARARERGTVLFHLDGGRHWPEALDLSVAVAPGRCVGIGQGHGHLQFRQLEVATVGRRAANRQRRVSVLVGGPGGSTLERVDTPDVAGWVDGRDRVGSAGLAGGVGPADQGQQGEWAGSVDRGDRVDQLVERARRGEPADRLAADGIVWADGVDGVVWGDGLEPVGAPEPERGGLRLVAAVPSAVDAAAVAVDTPTEGVTTVSPERTGSRSRRKTEVARRSSGGGRGFRALGSGGGDDGLEGDGVGEAG